MTEDPNPENQEDLKTTVITEDGVTVTGDSDEAFRAPSGRFLNLPEPTRSSFDKVLERTCPIKGRESGFEHEAPPERGAFMSPLLVLLAVVLRKCQHADSPGRRPRRSAPEIAAPSE